MASPFSDLDIVLAMRSGARSAEIAMLGAKSAETGLNISARNTIAQNLVTFGRLGLEGPFNALLAQVAQMPRAMQQEILGRAKAIELEQRLIQPIPFPRADQVPEPIPHPKENERFPRKREGKDTFIEDMKFEEEPNDPTVTDEEAEAASSSALSFSVNTFGPAFGVSNPGAGWGGSSFTNEGGFATIDSNGNITNSVTGQTIGQSTINTTNTPSISIDSGGNTVD